MTGVRRAAGAPGRDAGRRVLRALALAVVVVTVPAACVVESPAAPTPQPETRTDMPTEAMKSGDRTVRHDVEPLVTRIPTLEGVTDVTWFSGRLGDDGVPGPSLYWIDAVVVLPEPAAEELRASLDLSPAGTAPDVVAELVPHLPAGPVLTGRELDEAFSRGGWRTTAYLSESGAELVLVIVGE